MDKFEEQVRINRSRRRATNNAYELDIYVPLGLIGRKHQPRRDIDFLAKGEITSEKGTAIYELPQEVIEKVYKYNIFLEEVIGDILSNKNNKNIAIIGEPGAGKTTLLEKIGKYLLANQALPIYIPLSNLSGFKLKQYLYSIWMPKEANPEQLRELLNTKQVWFLLDGVDEINASASAALNQIISFINELPKMRFVVTCRLNVWDASTKNLLDFQNYKTQDFTHEQVKNFINLWFERAKSYQGYYLWRKLNEPGRERLLDLVKNPLRLALMCQAWHLNHNTDLPSTQAALYDRFVRNFYEWKQEQFYTIDEQDKLNKSLGKLAQVAIDSSQIRFRIGEKLAILVMGNDLFNLSLTLGWLNQVDRDKETDEAFYAFYHATFQEYFAAIAIDDWSFFLPRTHKNKPIKNERYRIFETEWRQVFLLWVGRQDIQKEYKEEFFTKLINFQDGCDNFYKYQAYFLAGLGTTEFKKSSISSEIINQILKWSQGDFSTIELFLWRENLHILIEEDAKVALSQINKDKKAEVLDKFGKVDKYSNLNNVNEDAIDLLVKDALGNDKYRSWTAIQHLSQISDSNQYVIKKLADLTWNALNKSTCVRAAEVLAIIDPSNQDAVDVFAKIAWNARNEYDRREAVHILCKISVTNQFAIKALAKLDWSAQGTRICRQVVSALGEVEPGQQDAINLLIELIRDVQDIYTRRIAVLILGKISANNQDAINALIKLAWSAQDIYTRRVAVLALGEVEPGQRNAINMLVKLIRNVQSGCMKEAIPALKRTLTDDFILFVIAQLKNRSKLDFDVYDVIWKSAKSLTYPEFYKAWRRWW